MGGAAAKGKTERILETLVNGKLKRGRKEMYLDIRNQVSCWALDDVTVRGRAMRK